MREVELVNVTVGSTRIVVWMESSLSDNPLGVGQGLNDLCMLINNSLNEKGPSYFFPELEMELWVSTKQASLYKVTIHNTQLVLFGQDEEGLTDDALKASLTTYVTEQAELIENFNSVSAMF